MTPLQVAEFDAVALRCAPTVAVSTLRAIVTQESSFNRYAIGVVGGRLERQPGTLAESVSTTLSLDRQGLKYSAGVAQIYRGNWERLGLDHVSVFDACSNVRAAAEILGNCYARASRVSDDPQHALMKALSCYYSNNFVTGFAEGYVASVVAQAQRFERMARAKTTPDGRGIQPGE